MGGQQNLRENRKQWFQKEQGAGPQKAKGPRGPPPCSMCKEDHPLEFCAQFMALDKEAKGAHVKERNRCTICLKSGHEKENCYSRGKCYKCGELHHFLLHEVLQGKEKPGQWQTKPQDPVA